MRTALALILIAAIGPAAAQGFSPACPPSPKSVCLGWKGQNFSEAASEIRRLYITQRYGELEKVLWRTTNGQRRFIDGTSYADMAYYTFRQLLPAPGTVAEHARPIEAWQKAVPNSIFVHFAKARFAYGRAWNMRGDQWGNTVSKEGWELFHIGLREAETILLTAPPDLQKSPLWHRLLLAISLDLPHPTRSPADIFDDATRRWPLEFGFQEVVLARMVPRWGGSWKTVDAFVGRWTDRLAKEEGKSLYARLYLGLLRTENASDTPVDWKRLQPSLEDLVSRYPSSRFKNLYGSFACLYQDKKTFRSAVGKISRSEVDPSSWLPGHAYEACMRWAGT